jgi:hypothetical protein
MKWLLHSVIVFGPLLAFAQSYDWSEVDYRIKGIYSEDPASLARMLTVHCRTDAEKARSIFRWIADNIEYHRTAPRPARLKEKLRGYQLPEDTGALLPLSERVSIKVLKDGKTHCEGFARLFYSLCTHAGLKVEIITGYARTGGPFRFNTNHAWNAVYIDGQWQLMDVTWASGHFDQLNNPAARAHAERFFMAEPRDFYRQHFPDDLRWAILPQTTYPSEMRKAPYQPRSFGKYAFTSHHPTRGIIEAQPGDTLHFYLRTRQGYRNQFIAPDSLWDPELRWFSPQLAYLEPDRVEGENVYYEYVVPASGVQWLHLLYNDDVVLRYRLEMKSGSVMSSTAIGGNALREDLFPNSYQFHYQQVLLDQP